MLETGYRTVEDVKLTTSEKLMKTAFDALVNRCREGIKSGRISVVIDAGEESQEPALNRLAHMLQEGGIVVANHTAPSNIIEQLTHTKLDFGSTPMDAIILIALLEEMKDISNMQPSPKPMMLRGVKLKDSIMPENVENPTAEEKKKIKKAQEDEIKTMQHIELDRKATSHRLDLENVTLNVEKGVGMNRSSLKKAKDRIGEGGVVIIFPEGTTHRAHDDLSTHKVYEGATLPARPNRETGSSPPIVPIYIHGSESYSDVLAKGTDKVQIYIGSPQHMGQQEIPAEPLPQRAMGAERHNFMQRVWGEVVRMQHKYDPKVEHPTLTPIQH